MSKRSGQNQSLNTKAGACASVLLLICVAHAAFAEDAGRWSVTPLLPPDTLAVVTLRDVKKGGEKLQQTGLWQIAANPDVQRAFSAPMLKAQLGLAIAEGQLGMKVSELASFFSQGEITLAVLGVDKRTNKGEPFPDLLISIQALDKAQALTDEINRRIDQLKAALNGNLLVDQIQAGNAVINQYTVPIPEQPITFSYASVDGNILVAIGEGRIAKILAMREAAKANGGVVPAPANGAAVVLSQVPAFKRVVEKAGPENDLLAFLNFELLVKNPILDAHPKTAQQTREWEMAGLNNVHSVAYCAGIKGKGIREVLIVDSPAAERKGFLGLIEEGGVDANAFSKAPKNSLAAVAFNGNPQKFLDKFLDIAAVDNPNAKEQVNTFLVMLGQQLNVDIKKELFSAITGEAVLSVSMPVRHSKLPVGFPEPLLSVGIKDVAALKNVLSAIRRTTQDNLLFSELNDAEHEIVTGREKFPKGNQAGQFSYTIDKNDLLISLYPLAIREEIRRRAAGNANDGGSLADDADFAAARANLTGKSQMLAYVDTAALGLAAYEILIPIAQLQPRNPEVDLSVLPAADVLARNLCNTVISLGADADSVMAEGYSPGGTLAFISVAIPAAAAKARQTAIANRVEQQVNQHQDAMADVGRELQAYIAANGGNYPATLPAMQPKYLAGIDAGTLATIVYRGKQDAANKVVAHSSEKAAGPITALLQDGSVVKVKRQRLGPVLLKGYSPDAAAALANEGQLEAVKPPSPPDF